jgi:L-rhamnose mutarotase
MLEALRESGWTNYSLFLRDDGLLIGYLETENFELAKQRMEDKDVNTKWQREMAAFFVAPQGLTPGPSFQRIREVFHLD